MKVPPPELMIFAKLPVPAAVKTRLMPTYTAAQAAEIARAMIHMTVELAVSNWRGTVSLWVWPDTRDAWIEDLARRFRLDMEPQCPGDLGAKMHHALAHATARGGAAAVMGCDVPHCDGNILKYAAETLGGGKNVLGPTDDGGYYLIGMQQPHAALFTDIAWGGRTVLASTLGHAKTAGVEFELLAPLRDIDTPGDLQFVAQAFEPLRQYLTICGEVPEKF